MLFFRKIPTSLLVLLLSSGSIFSQSGDGLDFLDKVENIQIPKETDEPKTGSTKTTTTTTKPSTTTKTTTTTVKPTPTQPAPQKTVTKTSPKTTVTKTTSTPTKTVPKQQPAPTTIATTNTTPPPTTRVAPVIEEEIVSPEKASQLWIDAPLAMDPDYLPGFSSVKGDLADNKLDEEDKKESEPLKEFSRPLPQLDGNFSIWGSLMEFLSKYQKAFYIFGILLLFAIYRLKSGRNSSSSRKSTPTIRRMRR
jgi:Sec region non-globular protein